MSWQLTRMSDWSSAGGIALANLGPAKPGSQIRRELGGSGSVSLVMDRAIAEPWATGGAIVRIDGTRTGALEVRVSRHQLATRGTEAAQLSVQALPRIFDLSDADLLYEELGGRKIFRFNGALTAAQALTRFFFVRQAQDGLLGIGPGVLGYSEPIPLQWERITRGELLVLLQDALQAELNWRINDAGQELIDLVPFVGDEAVPVPLVYGDRLRDHQIEEEPPLGTAVRIAGEPETNDGERATIDENLWEVRSVRALGGGATALELRAPGTMESPILEDGMYAAHPDIGLPARHLQYTDGVTRRAITASSVASSEVTITGTAPAAGERVTIVADAQGTPLDLVELPSAIRAVGRRVRDVQISGGRGERQYARNGGHENGLTNWSSVHGGAASEYFRSEFGVIRTALVATARAAAVGTGTPLSLKSAIPGSWVRKGMMLKVGGADLAIENDAIPDDMGALELEVSAPGLPGAYADNAPLTLVRRDVRALTLDGDQSPLMPFLRFADSDTDALLDALGGALAAAVGDYVATNAPPTYDAAAVNGARAGTIRVSTVSPSVQLLTWPTYADDTFAVAVNIVAADSMNATFTLTATPPETIVAGTTRFRYVAISGQLITVKVTAVSGLDCTVEVESLLVAPAIFPYPNPFDAGLGGYAVTGCNVLLADGSSWAYTQERETRVLNLDGAHLAAATTLTFKPQAVIATRNWLGTDSLELSRSFGGTLVVTAWGAPVDVYEDETGAYLGKRVVGTVDLGASTFDAIDPGDLPPVLYLNVDVVEGSTRAWRYESLVGTDLTLFLPPGWTGDTPTPSTIVAEWTLYETYALTGTASWNANGRVTLTLATAVPAGRSYARGATLWSNWHTRAVHGGASQLRLHADLEASDTTVEVEGLDAWVAGSLPLSAQRCALYRVFASGSDMPIPGNTLFAAASAQVAPDGTVSVTLTAANPVAIAVDEVVTMDIPALRPADLDASGSAMRLFSPVGGDGEPVPTSGGEEVALSYVAVPAGTTRSINARARFSLSVGDWFAGHGPVVAIVDAAENILGFARLGDDGATIESTPGEITLTARAVIATSGMYGARVYGGNASDFTQWCVHWGTFFYRGEATDAPYTPEAWATRLMLAGLAKLAQLALPRISDRLTIEEWDAARLLAAGVNTDAVPPIVLGGRVHLESVDRIDRVVAYTERPGQPVAEVEIGQLARDGSRLLAQTAIATNVAGVR